MTNPTPQEQPLREKLARAIENTTVTIHREGPIKRFKPQKHTAEQLADACLAVVQTEFTDLHERYEAIIQKREAERDALKIRVDELKLRPLQPHTFDDNGICRFCKTSTFMQTMDGAAIRSGCWFPRDPVFLEEELRRVIADKQALQAENQRLRELCGVDG